MKITILGGGPAGLYCALLLKKADPARDVTLLERNAPDATYGWGVVFSDRTLAAFREADHKTYTAISDHFVTWEAIDTYVGGELVRCGGHIFAGLARKQLLAILQQRCRELGVSLWFNADITDATRLGISAASAQPQAWEVSRAGGPDLFIAADGVNSLVRAAFADTFKPSLVPGKAKYIWLGTNKVLDAFTFIFRENEHGFFQVHAYPFDGTTSTFIVECAEETWRRAGLDSASEAESIAYCERLFAEELHGARLLSNNSKWISFVTVKNATWRHGNVVLLGDAAHTAHFSIGSGTKLAMEDAIALANAIERHTDLATALREYEAERRPIVETLQEAARESQRYFEEVSRYRALAPIEFTFNLLTRSGRVTYDDLRVRDVRFGESADRWFAKTFWTHAGKDPGTPSIEICSPAPTFTPMKLQEQYMSTRLIIPLSLVAHENGIPELLDKELLDHRFKNGPGAFLLGPVGISLEARTSPESAGIFGQTHRREWARILDSLQRGTDALAGILLNHAGRRGATRPRREGLDRPLRKDAWPLVSASPIPYTPRSQTPAALDRAGMERVRDDFAHAAQMADTAGFELLMLHMGHGYLLASFLSPLANVRDDEYGGTLESRLRFPLEVFDAVRAGWPAEKPLAVALTCDDWAPGGISIDEAIPMARALKAHGCDLIQVLAGQTIPDPIFPAYGRGFLTPLSDRVRNEAGIPTLVGGYLPTTNEVNTILAAGRADLCLVDFPYKLSR